MTCVAAVGDIHLDRDLAGHLRPALEQAAEAAQLILVAGDLTRHGTLDEAAVVADELGGLPVPVVCVLGNHDYHSDQQDAVRAQLEDAGIVVLEGETFETEIDGTSVGVAGAKGFGIGFAGRCASDFGEPEMKAFTRYAKHSANIFRTALERLHTDVRIAMTHFAPVEDTLHGEPPEIWPFLGSYLLAEAADAYGADLYVHGHAHAGTEHGMTAGGIQVRNVAQPVLRRPFALYRIGDATAVDTARAGTAATA
ncbi:MAG: metallophosphoesterase family protein [Acidothermaceae bacterium]